MKFYIKLRGSCQSKTDKGNYSEVYYHFGESALSIDVFFKENWKKKKKKKKKTVHNGPLYDFEKNRRSGKNLVLQL